MKTLVNALIAYLATRRLTSLMVEDKITEDIREKFWEMFPPEEKKLGYLVTCRKCSSMWAGVMALCLLTLGNNLLGKAIATALALSEASIITDRLLPSEDFNL